MVNRIANEYWKRKSFVTAGKTWPAKEKASRWSREIEFKGELNNPSISTAFKKRKNPRDSRS